MTETTRIPTHFDPAAEPRQLDEYRWMDDAAKWLVEAPELPPFHVGQNYEHKPATALKCICGCATFHLAQGSYFTAVRCTTCGKEHGVHEG